MSSVIVLTPVIVTHWGTISAAITAAVAAAGFSRLQSQNRAIRSTSAPVREELTIEESRILSEASASTERMVVEQNGIRATFCRGSNGALKVCMEAERVTRAKLRQMGNELVGRVTQQYVYHHLITELKRQHMVVIDEEVEFDQTVRIRVRSQ